ncbi:hypothetical protein J437_LFUL013082 [Ladona fulva]|uniref:Uncharacterized protein n=1 Tax=Ladona fulva TaxID=123851 RepID=A0A8K0KEN7_LADFU|nr:hypothetical protein J437_LFUL013082 [Ladona fulva]
MNFVNENHDDSSNSHCENKCLNESKTDFHCFEGQKLSKLPNDMGDIENMTKLILKDNLFSDLPSEICFFQSLKVLNVAKNKLKLLPEELGNLINLEALDVSENQLEKLPNSLSMASKLQILDASKNSITEIPQEYKHLKKLNRVNLSHNKLTEVPYALTFGSHCISGLDLSYNSIKDFTNEPKCASSLKELKINNNHIKDLPVWIRSLHSIEELHIGNNPFTISCRQSLDSMFSVTSVNVKIFGVTSCGLIHLPFCLKNMPNILSINAGNDDKYSDNFHNMCNTIWDVGPLLDLGYLRELRLANVSLPLLPEGIWKSLKCLEVLDLRGNNLTWLPEGLSCLVNLIYCTLSCNRLALLPADIGDVNSLKELDLAGNQLSDLPESISKLENLAYLDLYDNELCEFPLALCKLSCLKYLDLEMNNFIADEFQEKIPSDIAMNYATMKDKLRSSQSKQNRIDGTKKPPSSISEEDFFPQKSRSPSPQRFECPELHDSSYNGSVEDEEDWEKSDGSDNCQALRNGRNLWHWARDNGRWEPPVSGDVFCPADIHPDTLSKPTKKKETVVNDGQFEDADLDVRVVS